MKEIDSNYLVTSDAKFCLVVRDLCLTPEVCCWRLRIIPFQAHRQPANKFKNQICDHTPCISSQSQLNIHRNTSPNFNRVYGNIWHEEKAFSRWKMRA